MRKPRANYKGPPLDNLLHDVCATLGTDAENLASKCRKRKLTVPRQIFCYVAFFYTTYPAKKIGEVIGGRDHTTVIYSRDVVVDLIDQNDSKFMLMWEEFKEKSVYWHTLQLIRVARSKAA